jgi:hypothetical protein
MNVILQGDANLSGARSRQRSEDEFGAHDIAFYKGPPMCLEWRLSATGMNDA